MAGRAGLARPVASRLRSALPALAIAFALSVGASIQSCGGGGGGGGTVAAGLSYSGPTHWTATGPAGGPFTDERLLVILTNDVDQTISWAAVHVPSFVDVNPRSQTIPAGSRSTVELTLDDAFAATLPPGVYVDTLKFVQMHATPPAEVDVECTLSVLSPGVSARLSPDTDFTSQGAAAGPFLPARKIYTLTNTGNAPLAWEAAATDPWISTSPPSGNLAVSASVDVTVSVDDGATSALPLGGHASVVEWKESASGAILDSRLVSLNILTDSSASGWTTLVPSADTRVVYVSSSEGDDGNNGLSVATPVRSLAVGHGLLRDGFPDWLLLKCGDAWDEDFSVGWGLHGRSDTERMVLSYYGAGHRPEIHSGTDNCMNIWDGPVGDNLAIVGIRFWPNLYDGSNGAPHCIGIFGGVANVLIEDCYMQAGFTNIVLDADSVLPAPTGRHKNIAIRRNVVVDAYTTGPDNVAGLFASGVDGLLVEGNLFDRNGWRDDVPGSIPTIFRRNVYIQDGNTDAVVRENIVARTDGMQVRCGGIVEDNLCMKNAISILFGGGDQPNPDGVTGSVHHNVMLDGNDLLPGDGRGWGFNFENVGEATVDANVIAHNVSGHAPRPVTFGIASNNAGVKNLTFSNNVVFGWGGYLRFVGDLAQTQNVHLANNVMQNEITQDPLIQHEDISSTLGVTSTHNVFFSIAVPTAWMQANGPLSLLQWKLLVHDTTSIADQAPFPDPDRTIATYNGSLGGDPSLEGFLEQARLQSRANWRTQYTSEAVNAYIRAGFGL